MSDVNLIKPAKAMLHSTAAAFNQELRNCQKLKLIIKADLSTDNPEQALTQEQKDALRAFRGRLIGTNGRSKTIASQ